MKKKHVWSIALAFLLTITLLTGQQTLAAKDIAQTGTDQVQATEEKGTESAKQDVEATTEKAENKEQSQNLPKIGGGGSKNGPSREV